MMKKLIRIAYYLKKYPVLSETFIRREITELKRYFPVEVFSNEPKDVEYLDTVTRNLIKTTNYIFPMESSALSKYLRYFYYKNPEKFITLLFFVLLTKYDSTKTFVYDRNIFLTSIYLAANLQKHHIDHVHSPWADTSAFISLLASKLLNITYSVQARAFDIHHKNYSFALNTKFKYANVVITNSYYNAQYLVNTLNNPLTEKIKVNYNGIDLDQFHNSRKVREKTLQILCVSRLVEQKGIEYLLKACKKLKDSGIGFQCRIAGGHHYPLYYDYHNFIMRLYTELNLCDNVHFLGSVPFNKIMEEYHKADVFVLPCIISENGSRDITPNAVIEAMAMKLPVISTNITAIPEIVDNGINGILVPPGNEMAIYEAIKNIAEDRKLAKSLGDNARKKVEEKFDIKKNIDNYVSIYNKIM